MPLFAVICRDKPDHLQTRMDTRERHLAYVGENPGVLLAGPFLEDGKPCGSLLIVQGDSLGAVADWAAHNARLARRAAWLNDHRFASLHFTGPGTDLTIGFSTAVRTATENGFTLMIPPVLVRPEVMEGTGFLGAHADEVYHLDKDDDLYLVGTSEVALAGLHQQILRKYNKNKAPRTVPANSAG